MHQKASLFRIINRTMNKIIKNLKEFKPIEPSDELFGKIVKRLNREQNFFVLKLRLAIFSVCLILSSIAFVPVFKMLGADLSQSGFTKFLSLLFSDFEIIKNYWQSFVFVLLETLPIASLIIFLGIIFMFFESAYILVSDLKIYMTRQKLIN